MRKLIAACAVALAVLAVTRPTSAAEPQEAPKARAPEVAEVSELDFQAAPGSFEGKVEDAVERGCNWLKKQQLENGLWPDGTNPTYGGGTPHKYEVGRSAFPIWALCKSGVFADDPAIEKAMNWLRKNYEAWAPQPPAPNPSWCTYENACVVNAIEAYYISKWEAVDAKLDNPKNRVKRDADGKVMKDANGKPIPITRWGTEEKGAKKKKKDRKITLDPKDRKLAERATKALVEAFQKGAYGTGGWRYNNPDGNPGPKIDVSATQYAMLGFGAASRLGISYKKDCLIDAYKFFMAEQDKDGPAVAREEKKEGEEEKKEEEKPKKDPDKGTKVREYKPKAKDRARGWGYCRKDIHSKGDEISYGSMTCAGICGLTVLRDELIDDPTMASKYTKDMDAKCNQAIADGLAWMVANWSVKNNPARGMYRFYYYLYALERLAMLGGLDYIGKHDWYYEGALVMLEQQDAEGGWTKVGNEVEPAHIYNTCYALLFLKRATDGVKRPVPVFTGDDHDD